MISAYETIKVAELEYRSCIAIETRIHILENGLRRALRPNQCLDSLDSPQIPWICLVSLLSAGSFNGNVFEGFSDILNLSPSDYEFLRSRGRSFSDESLATRRFDKKFRELLASYYRLLFVRNCLQQCTSD